MSNPDLKQRQIEAGPKRILALDGGGVRGILSLGYLKKIETLLRERYQDSEYVLSSYFDMIGGTSTGAIIAAYLAKGGTVDDLISLYQGLANSIFRKRFWRRGLIFTKFKVSALNEILKREFENMTFSDPKLRTTLVVVAKRWDLNSTWVVNNIQNSSYYKKYTCGYSVSRIVRASTAAPTFFSPERIEVKPGQQGAFVDGGVTPHNNPALQLFMIATLNGYGLDWPLGEDELSLVSVGTGRHVENRLPNSWLSKLAMSNGLTSLIMMMDGASDLNETLLQWLANSPTAREIDRELGSLANDTLGGKAHLRYVRYNTLLNTGELAKIGVTVTTKQAKALANMDDTKNVELLLSIGSSSAESIVDGSHFTTTFDRPNAMPGG